MKLVNLVGIAAISGMAASQGLFENLGDSSALPLVKRRTDSCGRPLRQDWKPRGAYSKHGGGKKGKACPAMPSQQSPMAPAKAIAESEKKVTHKHKPKHHGGHKSAPKASHTQPVVKKVEHKPSPQPMKKAAPKEAAPKAAAPKEAGPEHEIPKESPKPITKEAPKVAEQPKAEPEPAPEPKIAKEQPKPEVQDTGVSIQSTSSNKGKRGLTWTVDNNLAPMFQSKQIGWYLHFQDPVVPEMPSDISFVPTLWGGNADAVAKFQATMAGMNGLPEYMLAFNEPDIPTQANMSPQEAARVFKQYLQPYADKGVKVGAPSIAWDVNWLKSFFNECTGCTISFLSGHYYVGHTEASILESRVKALHDAFPDMKIWVTEYGATTAGGGNAQDVLKFAQQTTSFLESQSYIDRVAFFGVYQNAPDGYVNQNCAFIDGGGQLTEIGNWWVHG